MDSYGVCASAKTQSGSRSVRPQGGRIYMAILLDPDKKP